MDNIVKEVIQLLSKSREGLKVSEFSGAYQKHFCKTLVLSSLGFKKLVDLFHYMRDNVELMESGGEQIVRIKSENTHQAEAYYRNQPESNGERFTLLSKPGLNGMEARTKSYRDALQHRTQQEPNKVTTSSESGACLPEPAPVETDQKAKLKESIRNLLEQHPNGVPLSQVRKSCPMIYDPALLDSFVSTKHLLASLTDVLELRGIGVQTHIHPAGQSNLTAI